MTPKNHRLLVGQGYVENVEPAVWNYEVSGKQVLLHWFSYRKKDRERPIIWRPPSSIKAGRHSTRLLARRVYVPS